MISGRWNEFSKGIRASSDKSIKLTVTAESGTNWKLYSTRGQVLNYYLTSRDNGEKITTWEFSKEELNKPGGTEKPMGILVSGFDAGRPGSYIDNIKFTVVSEEIKVPVSSITFDKTSTTITTGNTETLTATIAPENATDKTLTWSTSDSSVATVDSTGKVTGIAAGTATITATANDGSGASASCEVTVKVLVSSINLNKTSTTITKGNTETLTATIAPTDAEDQTVTWSTSDSSVATVDSSGKVTGVAGGTATITATANDGSGKSASCTVTVKVLVSSITLNKTSLSDATTQGTKHQLIAAILPDNATDQTLTWSSDNTSVATVNSTGLVTIVTGDLSSICYITATANDGSGISAKCEVYTSN